MELKDHLNNLLVDLINDELNKSKWNFNDRFVNIKRLSIDQRGRLGEHFFVNVFKQLNLLESYNDNAHGDWDLEASGLKIEVKTATLDVNNKFQHEGAKANKAWDVIAFLDISPNDFYVTFIHKNDFEFNIDVFENNCIKKIGTVLLYDQKLNIHFRGKDGSDESQNLIFF